MAIKARKDLFNVYTNVDTTRIYTPSQLVSKYSGIPKDIGFPRGEIIVLNKNSGRHGLKAKSEELGFKLTEDEINRVFD